MIDNDEKHCCDMMQLNIEDERVQIFYSPIKRRYYINVMNGKRVAATQGLFYCPWCAKKLPHSLSQEYYDCLEKEYGIDFYNRDKMSLPKEFKTDEWWKKRGL